MMVSASRCSVESAEAACGNVTFMRVCCTNVVVNTKNIKSVSTTSISEITLISKSSSRRPELMRMTASARRSCYAYGRWRRSTFTDRCELVGKQVHLAFHFDDELDDASAEIAMENVRRNRDAQTRGRAHQGLADAAGHLHRIADAADHHREEHLDETEHRAEETQQRTDQRDGAERVEKALQPIHDVTAGVLDALLDDLARPIAHRQRRREQLAERRVRAQYAEMLGIDLARACPLAHFVAQAGRNHGRTPQR